MHLQNIFISDSIRREKGRCSQGVCSQSVAIMSREDSNITLYLRVKGDPAGAGKRQQMG
jgi:hypothetical protein